VEEDEPKEKIGSMLDVEALLRAVP
jgi:hypothetical protein